MMQKTLPGASSGKGLNSGSLQKKKILQPISYSNCKSVILFVFERAFYQYCLTDVFVIFNYMYVE